MNEMYHCINVTSFSSIPYCSDSEHWTRKCIQSGNIHSIILDVYADRHSAQPTAAVSTLFSVWRIYSAHRTSTINAVIIEIQLLGPVRHDTWHLILPCVFTMGSELWLFLIREIDTRAKETY